MRLGVFGGSFDPVHFGHLIVAELCREQADLDRLAFVPAARPPHKQDKALTPFEQRAEMLTLALSGNPALQIDDIEKHRSGPSYTADTLAAMKKRQPEAELFLLMGADMVQDLPTWYEPQQIIDLATLVVAARPGWGLPDMADVEKRLSLPTNQRIRHQIIEAPLMEISSTDLRRRIAAGRSIRYQTPRAVEVYISEKGLYQR